jgi:hypothetical protein
MVLAGSRLTRLVGACGCGVFVWSVKKAVGKGAFVSGFVWHLQRRLTGCGQVI